MKCRIIKMRKDGVDFPKRHLAHQRESHGDLELLDVRDNGIGRTVHIARLMAGSDGKETLFEPHIVWMNGQRMLLAGFEQVPAHQIRRYREGMRGLPKHEWRPLHGFEAELRIMSP